MHNIRIVAKDYPNHTLRPTPKNYIKKKSSTQKLKIYLKMKYSNIIVAHLMITYWKVRYWWKKKPLFSFNDYLAQVELIIL